MTDPAPTGGLATAWRAVLDDYRQPETQAVDALRPLIVLSSERRHRVHEQALALAAAVRHAATKSAHAEAFLQRYGLATQEGVVLMCLAEALLRIPDERTADALIRDKLAGAHWRADDGGPALVNAAAWALMLTGRLAAWHDADGPHGVLQRLAARLGEPLVRAAIRHAVDILAGQFVAGETMDEALRRARRDPRYRHSYDMLGEAALTADDADRYYAAYRAAIASIAAATTGRSIEARDGLSVKLSALHPRYEPMQRDRVMRELLARVIALCRAAREAQVPVTIDAEESERLLPSLALFEALAREPSLNGWDGLGLAVQAYQKRAVAVCRWLAALAAHARRRLLVRLVKGAYWDSEVKRTQVLGLADYAVYTRKSATDACYLACAQVLLEAGDRLYPQFATHNCQTVAYVLECTAGRRDFEFQKLHGMGDALYDTLLAQRDVACRVYAPVGSHRELLPYLVRRLLENGANTSFVHRIGDPGVPLERLTADPLDLLPQPYQPNPRVPLPRDIFPDRRNARGLDLSDPRVIERLEQRIDDDRRSAAARAGEHVVAEPADRRRIVGSVPWASAHEVDAALAAAQRAWRHWDATPATERARTLERTADAIEADIDGLVSLLVREAGKCYADSVSEVREAADFLRYYAARARAEFAAPLPLPAPVGEANRLELGARGVFACVSPWNFPLAIFIGQVSAALAAGNAAIAKPAEQTPLVAARAVALLHEAGVPRDVLHVLPGTGTEVGARLVRDPRIDGVAFTGSFETALDIQRALAAREGPLVPFVAETGGLNAMVVDSSALPEQVVNDVLVSAFNSAGQRCSALRVLLVQEEAAPRVLALLAGAMHELSVGDPGESATDVGPVIDEEARAALERHLATLAARGRLIARAPLAPDAAHGVYVAPAAYEVALGDLPQREVFGPIVHVVRYAERELERVLDAVAATRYGLTLGIHTRIDRFVERVRARLRVGNTYVNRNMIGAVVGVQPFGGEGYSGTGPKAGGPYYLHRFAVERTVSVNTAAIGGSAELLAGE